MFTIWKNMLWFVQSFFSIKLLLKTFFSPWKRLQERHYRSEGISEFFANIIVNTLMRIVGIVIRTVVIIIGLICLIIATFSGLFLFGIWFVLPLLNLFIFIVGILSLVQFIPEII